MVRSFELKSIQAKSGAGTKVQHEEARDGCCNVSRRKGDHTTAIVHDTAPATTFPTCSTCGRRDTKRRRRGEGVGKKNLANNCL